MLGTFSGEIFRLSQVQCLDKLWRLSIEAHALCSTLASFTGPGSYGRNRTWPPHHRGFNIDRRVFSTPDPSERQWVRSVFHTSNGYRLSSGVVYRGFLAI